MGGENASRKSLIDFKDTLTLLFEYKVVSLSTKSFFLFLWVN